MLFTARFIIALVALISTSAFAQTSQSNQTTGTLTPLQKAIGAEPAASNVSNLPGPVASKKLRVGLVTSSFANVLATNTSSGQPVTTLNQFRLDYQLNEFDSLRLNQIVSSEWGPKASTSNSLKFGDVYLQYARSEIARFGDQFLLKTNARLYAPVSQATREKNQIAALRTDIELSKTFSKVFDVSLHVVPWLSYQSESSYKAVGPNGIVSQKPNSAFNLAYYLAGNANILKNLTFTQEAGLMRYWFKSSESSQLSAATREYLYLDSSLNLTINETFGVGLGLSSYLTRDLLDQQNEFSLYRSDETDYYLTASANF